MDTVFQMKTVVPLIHIAKMKYVCARKILQYGMTAVYNVSISYIFFYEILNHFLDILFPRDKMFTSISGRQNATI